MKKTLIAFLIGVGSASASAGEFDVIYQPTPSFWDILLDRGNNWVRRRGAKKDTTEYVLSVGGAPVLSQLQAASANWEPGACLASPADNSGVWINKYSSVTTKYGTFPTLDFSQIKSSNYKEFTIASSVPYELESKNYKSAGLKQFLITHEHQPVSIDDMA